MEYIYTTTILIKMGASIMGSMALVNGASDATTLKDVGKP